MLSVIIPFAGEFPQVLFAIRSVAEELNGRIPFEIIAVDNYCDELKEQNRAIAKRVSDHMSDVIEFGEGISELDIYEWHEKIMPVYKNKSGEAIAASECGHEWLRYIKYDKRLSHWQAKRVGVEASKGSVLLFLDAHVVPSRDAIWQMYQYYIAPNMPGLQHCADMGTLHLPLTYKILEWRRLIYKLVIEREYFYSYSFTRLPQTDDNYLEVPCMSTCGMMISRKIYDAIGGWPKGLGIYGGGENFMNYTLAVCGYRKFVFTPVAGIRTPTLYHHGERRDYHWYGDDFVKNRMIAHYLFGGEELLWNFVSIGKGNGEVLRKLANQAITEHKDQREKIKRIQQIRIEDWAKKWITQTT